MNKKGGSESAAPDGTKMSREVREEPTAEKEAGQGGKGFGPAVGFGVRRAVNGGGTAKAKEYGIAWIARFV